MYSENQLVAATFAAEEAMRNVPRYNGTGRCVIPHAWPEIEDTWTGRRGVYVAVAGVGLLEGSYVDGRGQIRLRHPQDNPFSNG
jgi:hypothetical protein